MDSSNAKIYSNVHYFDSRKHLDTFFSGKVHPDLAYDTIVFPMEKLRQAIEKGLIKGDSLIDISVGGILHLLYAVCDFFKQITVLKFNEGCVMEVTKWLYTRTGAYDWSHMMSILPNLKGLRQLTDLKELQLKTTVKQVLKCDLNKVNITDPVLLAPADCVLVAAAAEIVSRDREEFVRNMKKFAALVKPGGQLIFFGVLGATYFLVGTEKHHIFSCDENLVSKVLTGEGFTILQSEVLQSKNKSDLVDHKATMFLIAQRGA
ncbi:indolethylamine N-methyltransferase-like [Pyxicephalus adspersus]|uniref:Uncharacterized protein n=1 Tax=Pyxicephalus adspersus TaxID=30357 RepID=A0AAV2ZQ76_PYXAD|nr:TPA: hypothetical protein GDO54_003963 [Pyxicephalus adspersus]